jgi:hypothetical protein
MPLFACKEPWKRLGNGYVFERLHHLKPDYVMRNIFLGLAFGIWNRKPSQGVNGNAIMPLGHLEPTIRSVFGV